GERFLASVDSLVTRHADMGARTVRIYLQRIFKKLSGVCIAVFFVEEFAGAKLCINVSGISRNRLAINVVSVMESLEVNQSSCYACQLRGAVRLLFFVVSNQRFKYRTRAILLTGELQDLSLAQIARKFDGRIFRGFRTGSFELGNRLGVTAGRGKHFAELMTNARGLFFCEGFLCRRLRVNVASRLQVSAKKVLLSVGVVSVCHQPRGQELDCVFIIALFQFCKARKLIRRLGRGWCTEITDEDK